MGKVDKSLDPCPVCGKYPKVYKDLGYKADKDSSLVKYTNICTIRCKKPFKRAHISVVVGDDDYNEAYKGAAEFWYFEVNKLKGDLNG